MRDIECIKMKSPFDLQDNLFIIFSYYCFHRQIFEELLLRKTKIL